MKAFYLSDRKSPDYHTRDKKIISLLQRTGLNIDTSHFDSTAQQDASDLKGAYNKYMRAIKSSDLVIAEVSNMSSGLGFFISAALNMNKPVLALFNRDSKEEPSKTLKGSTDRLMHYVEYDWENIEHLLLTFHTEIQKKLDSKFILIISPEINSYLEWSSQEHRKHKAQIVREAIEKVMAKDKRYKQYLENP